MTPSPAPGWFLDGKIYIADDRAAQWAYLLSRQRYSLAQLDDVLHILQLEECRVRTAVQQELWMREMENLLLTEGDLCYYVTK
jgi:hypothetical protein